MTPNLAGMVSGDPIVVSGLCIKLFGKGISWEAGTFIQVGVSFAGYWAGALFRTPAREKKSREAFFNDL